MACETLSLGIYPRVPSHLDSLERVGLFLFLCHLAAVLIWTSLSGLSMSVIFGIRRPAIPPPLCVQPEAGDYVSYTLFFELRFRIPPLPSFCFFLFAVEPWRNRPELATTKACGRQLKAFSGLHMDIALTKKTTCRRSCQYHASFIFCLAFGLSCSSFFSLSCTLPVFLIAAGGLRFKHVWRYVSFSVDPLLSHTPFAQPLLCSGIQDIT